ncbi:MAG: hypothetical protein JWN78_408 [Bacteroidota bacterium]|nr:hypothetical protein [Bacteroidota bacterium]
MNRLFKILFLGCINILFLCCNCNTKYKCNHKYSLKIKNFVFDNSAGNKFDSTSYHIRYDSVIAFEKSLGSTIVFNRFSKDTFLYDFYKDSLLNPLDRYTDGTLKTTDYCNDCFFGEFFKTVLVAIRPQQHPFIKEVVVYADDFNNTYQTYYYYQNSILDKLIPPKILAQYQKDTFNIDEFWCFRDQLLEALDKYHGVGEQITRSYDSKKPKGKKKRILQNEGYNYIDFIFRENFTGTEADYKWLKKNRKNMRCYSWLTATPEPDLNKLYVNTYWYKTDLNGNINAGAISSPKDIYLKLVLTYRKDYVNQIIYK